MYTQWFDRVDPGRRMMAVGAKRYRSMERQLGGVRAPQWTDFIDADGKLLSVQSLRAETLQQREARLRRVAAAIEARRRLIADVSRFGFVAPSSRRASAPPIRHVEVWNPAQRRHPKGSAQGGQFAAKGVGAASGKPKGAKTGASDKAKFVGKKVGSQEQQAARKVSEEVARAIGGVTEEHATGAKGQKDKKPFDVRLGANDIEVKSLLKGKKQSISVHDDALLRKVEHIQANPKNTFHTVVVDRRNTYEGGKHSGSYSGHKIYYKRGSGRYSLSQMQRVGSWSELKRLIRAPFRKLPAAARGALPQKSELKKLRASAKRASEARKKRDKARKLRNKDLLRKQARARRQAKRQTQEQVMEIAIQFSGVDGQHWPGNGPFYLCQVGRWGVFSEWVVSQPDLPLLTQLVTDGEVENTEQLAAELGSAPDDGAGIVEELRELIGVGDPGESAVISGE